MSKSKKVLPSLPHHTKTRYERDKIKLQEFLGYNSRQRQSCTELRTGLSMSQSEQAEPSYCNMKASNFLGRNEMVDSPKVLFGIADQVRKTFRRKQSEDEKQNDKSFLRKSGHLPRMGEERSEWVELAKWMDQQLDYLRKKSSITIMDVLDYKQTVLNYGLGKIIDSVSRRCKQEGHILSLVWNNTFSMFQGVFEVLANAAQGKEQEKITETKELQKVFETNHQFLKEKNTSLQSENSMLLQKMKKVILWNKQIRRERKHLFTAKRVLQYRNITYFEGMEQSIQMLMQHTPQAHLIPTAKKILLKLARERKKKKKQFFKRQVDQEVYEEAKTVVYRWLNSNASSDDIAYLQEGLINPDAFDAEDLNDYEEMQKIDIYEFFKQGDQGVQVCPAIQAQATQHEGQGQFEAETMTELVQVTDCGSQYVPEEQRPRMNTPSKPKTGGKKQVEINGRSISRQNSIQSSVKGKPTVKLNKPALKSQSGLNPKFDKSHKKIDRSDESNLSTSKVTANRGYRGSMLQNPVTDKLQVQAARHATLSETCIEQKNNEDKSDSYESSIHSLLDMEAKDLQLQTTRRVLTNNSVAWDEDEEYSFQNNPTSHSFGRTIARRDNKKPSVAYLRHDDGWKEPAKLENKKFTQAYKVNKKIMNQDKEQFCNQLVRRRSFGPRRRVEHSTLKQAQDAAQIRRQLLFDNGFIRNRQKTPIQKSSYLNKSVENVIKKLGNSANVVKNKALSTSKGTMVGMLRGVGKGERPPQSKAYLQTSINTLTKYVWQLVSEYVRQIRRDKEGVQGEEEKVLYPLGIIVLERMTFKYGLKEIAEKKIQKFLQKVMSLAMVNEKANLYALLLGLGEQQVGADQLLLYLRCLVYFDSKGFRDMESSTVEVSMLRENLRPALSYFYTKSALNEVELQLELYFKEQKEVRVEGIVLMLIKDMIKRRQTLKLKYQSVYQLCMNHQNFFSNLFQLLRMTESYDSCSKSQEQQQPEGRQRIKMLRQIKVRKAKKENKQRTKLFDVMTISKAVREMVARSDIIDEQYGKSITLERFVIAAEVLALPTSTDVQKLIEYYIKAFQNSVKEDPDFSSITSYEPHQLQILSRRWKRPIPLSQDPQVNRWSVSQAIWSRVEDDTLEVMGKAGQLGLYIEETLFNLPSEEAK